MKINIKRYGVYLIRWQLTTPVLVWCIIFFASLGATWATVMANLIGGLIFFWVDRFIFQSDKFNVSWEVKDKVVCSDCNQEARGYRLVKSKNYDKSNDKYPKFRCESCSIIKAKEMKNQGVQIEHT
ncbi:MAG: hypothetical protein J7L15_08760 [Clostridiales bacterium]|nr:hypothetical protein [Clostridiales bacterium]